MAKNNNTLVFNGLMQGMSWDLIKEAKEEIQRHLGEKQPTKKDILTDWIIGKDYMLQLLGELYRKGGHLFLGDNYSLIDNYNLNAYMNEDYLNWINGVSGNNNSTNNNNNSLANAAKGAADSFVYAKYGDAAGNLIYGYATNNLGGANSDVWNKGVIGSGDNGFIGRIFGVKNDFKNAMDYATNYRNLYNIGSNASILDLIESSKNLEKSTMDANLASRTANAIWLLPWTPDPFLNAFIGYKTNFGLAKLFGYDPEENQKAIDRAVEHQWALDLADRNTVINNSLELLVLDLLQHMTKEGGKLKKSHKFAEGGLLNTYDYGLEEVNAGGSHEENPNEGVIVSYAPDGLPNKVEEGETIHNDYVYSKRLEANEKVLENNLLDKKYEGKSFADISKKLTEDRKQRPNDPISVRTNEENLNRLQDALEELKLDNKTKEVKRFLGSLNNDLLNALQLEMMDEYEAYAEQLAQQLEQEDLAYQEELAALEGIFGKGGHLFLTKGKIRYLGEDVPYYMEDFTSAYYNGTNPTTFHYHNSEDNKDYFTSLFGPYIGGVNTTSTLPYGLNNNITFIDVNGDKLIGGVPVLNGKRMSNEEQRNLVKRILTDLTGLGYDVKVDGLYGPKTRTALLHLARLNPEYKQWYNSRKEKGLPADSYNYYVEFIQNGGNLIDALPKPPKTLSNTNELSVVPKKDIPDVSKVPNIKGETEGKPYSSLAPLRFAEAFGSAGQYLSDILGLTNQPDYSNARMYQRAIDNIGGVNFTPIGNYLTYTPIDTEYLTNQQMATAAARRNYGNIAGNYTLGLLGNYNTLNQIGATAIAARLQDLEQKNKVAEFNRATNDRNSTMSLDAQKQNAALRALRALEYRYLADMMTRERDNNEAARAANYQNFMSNLAAIGREDFNYDQIKWMIDHGVFPVGAESYLTGLKI